MPSTFPISKALVRLVTSDGSCVGKTRPSGRAEIELGEPKIQRLFVDEREVALPPFWTIDARSRIRIAVELEP